ncbi:MAG: SDR family oxidoreductase [Acidimicrobiia bacterium]|nr:SDR family oxidoreductase [Acidimicrobiia bacterium]MYE73775.1 SDR family oxidoreductase [Acidimicrobiia bacterium]MYJ63670.1 SDR family oxidoreductase [Acidimicrobiia bacterium]
MSNRLEGRVAIVTGGANGLGESISRKFAAEGAVVVVADVDEAAMKQVADELGVEARQCDVSDRASIQSLVDDVVERHGKLDIMVANAGIANSPTYLELDDEFWDRMIAVNLTGVFLCNQIAARHMVARGGGGVLLNTSSILGAEGNPQTPAYAASKAGVISLTRSGAMALGQFGIRVNAVGPGYMKTRMTEGLRAVPELEKSLAEMVPLNRFGEPGDIADAAVFLASDEASYITGHTLFVDGGWLTHHLPARTEEQEEIRLRAQAEAEAR